MLITVHEQVYCDACRKDIPAHTLASLQSMGFMADVYCLTCHPEDVSRFKEDVCS